MAAELTTSTSRDPTVSAAPSAAAAHETWRESVLRGMLTVTAVVAPLLAALGIFVGATHRDAKDIAVMATAGLLLPLLGVVRPVPVRRRALVAILVLFATGIFLLGRAGFAAGLSVVIVTTCVLGVITLGRNLGFIMIGLSALAHVVIGLLVSRRILHLAPREVDPLLFRNWIRMAASTSLLAVLLATVIEFVIRHVEANAAAARRMLGELRIAYERLGLLHGRLEAAKEEERRFLAHELHDELGQSLTALKLRLQLDGRPPVFAPHEAAPQALALIDQLIARVRQISVDLRPPLLDEVGLGPALRFYLEGQAALSSVPIVLEFRDGTEGRASGPRPGDRLLPRRAGVDHQCPPPRLGAPHSGADRARRRACVAGDPGRRAGLRSVGARHRRPRRPPGDRRHARARARPGRRLPPHLAPRRRNHRRDRIASLARCGVRPRRGR